MHLNNLIVSINNGEFLSLPQNKFVYELYELFDPLSASYQALIDLQLKEASDFRVKADENYKLIKLIMSATIAILILLLLIVAYFIYCSIQNPLMSLRDTITNIATNADLTARAKVQGKDEIADTASNFNDMLLRIKI